MRKIWISIAAAVALLAGALPAGAEATDDAKATPVPAAPAAEGRAPAAKMSATAKKKLVNLNAATAKELKALPGGSDEEAARIIAGRPYNSKAVPRDQQGHQRGALLRDQVPGRGRRAGEAGRPQEVSGGPDAESTSVEQGREGTPNPHCRGATQEQ